VLELTHDSRVRDVLYVARETIYGIQKRFTHIVNHLSGLGKIFDTDELNIKI